MDETGRTPCVVPFCRRSQKGVLRWHICAEHYRAVPMYVKARARKLKRSGMRRGDLGRDAKTWWAETERGERIAQLIGETLKRAACKRATGL